jgi:hypothetical protein
MGLLIGLSELLMYYLLFKKRQRQLTVPITIVDHKSDDSWEFFSGTHLTKIKITSIEEAIEHDMTVKEIMDLPVGYSATRKSTDSTWIRYKTTEQRPSLQRPNSAIS